jgi:glycosyltransferase involved in cell wall biosynthesis
VAKKILVFTEMDFSGSGYYYLMTPIIEGLAYLGYDIKVVGVGYGGQEYDYNFSIVRADTIQDGVAISSNIIRMWKPDVFLCGFDIPLQIKIFETLSPLGIKYIAVTPLENPPLTQTWAASLMQMASVFFISKIGYTASVKAGLKNSDFLSVGVDTNLFVPASDDEVTEIRKAFGCEDDFVILTVADNQERKNLSASMKVVSLLVHPDLSSDKFDEIMSGKSNERIQDFPKQGKFKYIIVTREHSVVGHNLRDLAVTMDINKELTVIERGVPQTELRKLYVMSDIFLLLSKAEGLGIPVLEAMSCGTPVIATDTGALTELLEGGRGYLVKEKYGFTDVWGNSWRSLANVETAVGHIKGIMSTRRPDTTAGREFVLSRTLEDSVNKMDKKIKELTDGQ